MNSSSSSSSMMPSDAESKNDVVGYICVLIAILFFGSNWIVVKKFPAGDGFFLQWMMLIGILIIGTFTMLIRGATMEGPIYFEPFAMLGGALWCTGNLLCVPSLQMIGLSLGPAIWGIGNMVTGWITGTFGLFGLHADKNDVKIFWLNIVGAILAAISVPCYALIKTKTSKDPQAEEAPAEDPEVDKVIQEMDENKEESHVTDQNDENQAPSPTNEPEETNEIKEHPQPVEQEESPIFIMIKSMPVFLQRIVGVVLALIAGIFFGSNFDPPKYLQDNGLSSPNGIDYVLSHFLGIFISSTLYFICYAICFRNKPFMYRETTFPGIVSGMMWGVAQVCWFIANSNLPYVVSFPLITSGPGLLSQIWGIFVFGEVRGWKNFIFFGIGTFILIIGIVCIVVSK
ncbi:transmembrane protein, putative [Entamoeba histolytica KU27]|uniref:Transmembrane protein, putative n=1 Tax=Entamoeba histolytica KU27 TaxID=885311 RepID=M2QFG8_ENTHI|nr:transmembrane protein, putative [Entamoeba histolytica KU27]